MIRENLDSSRDECAGRGSKGRICFKQEIRQPIEVRERLPRIDQLRQGLALGFLAL